MQLAPEVYGPVAIGQRLLAARTRAAYSLEDAARACMMEPRVLAAIERGARATPDDALLCRLAGLYHTHPAVLRYGQAALRDALATEVAAALARGADELQRIANDVGVVLGTPVTPLRPLDVVAEDELHPTAGRAIGEDRPDERAPREIRQ